MRGTVVPVNAALIRPLLIAGVERRLFLLNAMIAWVMIYASHIQLWVVFSSALMFIFAHFILLRVSKIDPMLATLFKRSTRYSIRAYFPAISHPSMTELFKIHSVSRPW